MSSAYSGAPLAKKLGIKPGCKVWSINSPKAYQSFFNSWPVGAELLINPEPQMDFIHIFATTQFELNAYQKDAKPRLKTDGILWISWPKKSSKIPTEIDKFDVMRAGQSIGLVDVKVAAIDADWSGHKFVYRLKDR